MKQSLSNELKFILWIFAFSWGGIVLYSYFLAYLPEHASTIFFLPVLLQFTPSLVGIYFLRKKWKLHSYKHFFLATLSLKGIPKRIILLSIFTMPLVGALLLFFLKLFQPQLIEITEPQLLIYIPLIFFGVLFTVGLLFGGISEEYGFRGFLQNSLLERNSPISTVLIVSLVWTLWHLDPEIVSKVFSGDAIGSVAVELLKHYASFFISAFALTLFMYLLYYRYPFKVIIPILIHSSYNTTVMIITNLFISEQANRYVLDGLGGVLILVIVVVMLKSEAFGQSFSSLFKNRNRSRPSALNGY